MKTAMVTGPANQPWKRWESAVNGAGAMTGWWMWTSRASLISSPHDLLMKGVEKHTICTWHLLYIRRWLQAPLQHGDGKQSARDKGAPQGPVVSPLLANLFLHYCMDRWLQIHYPHYPFERYADDAVIYCHLQAHEVKEALRQRLAACGLELHPEKTKVVYCKDSNRKGKHEHQCFDFLGYGFQPRLSRNKQGQKEIQAIQQQYSFSNGMGAESAKSSSPSVCSLGDAGESVWIIRVV